MAVDAENICFENVGFGCFMGSSGFAFGNQDEFCFTEPAQRVEIHPHDNLACASSSSSFSNGTLPLDIMQSVSCELEKQKMEMDWFLQMENQRLRSSILLQLTRQREVILQKYESKMKILMLQKDEQLAVAKYRAGELQNSLRTAEMEAKSWQKKAKENEAAVNYLKNKLKAAQEQQQIVSFCESSTEKQEAIKDTTCKVCHTRRMCSVFLPCRHVCCCNYCEPLLGHCPICGTVKESSLEVLLG